ncbi:MAG: HD domain-containing phosphohydrolase, partial [Terriglobia bacterium]
LEEAKKGEAQRFQYESECTNGVRWFESTLTPVRDRSGNVRSFIRISRDITEARSSSEKIKETLGKLTETFEETVHSLGSMLEKRDPYTAGHQERVSTVAAAIAEEMGLSEDQVTGIRIGALIHDTGKINIPAEILSKPGRLTDIEFDLIRSHAEIGYQILKDIKFPWPVAQIAHEHHERMDGSGYPRGLSGESIMLEARILAVADVVEAMASHRPYRAAKGIDEALDEIEKNKGHLYDAKVVEACLTLFRTKGLELDAKGSRPEIGLAAKS